MSKQRKRQRRKKKTRGEHAKDKVDALRLVSGDELSSNEMLKVVSNIKNLITADMLEDERAQHRVDWRKLSDAQRARISVGMHELLNRKSDFEIPLNAEDLPEGEEGQRSFEQRLLDDPEMHDFSKHPNVRTGKDKACFWWWEKKRRPHMEPVQLRVLYEHTQYSTFLSVMSRIWEDCELIDRWKGKTWDDALNFIKDNYGQGEACHRTRGTVRYTCFSVDNGGRFYACVRMEAHFRTESSISPDMPPTAEIFAVICGCKNPLLI